MTPPPAISVERLIVNRGGRRILDEIEFEVAPGEIVGLLGPNGAGKTTTLAVLSTLLVPSAGNVRIAGHDLKHNPKAVRRSIGCVPQEIAVYPALTVYENATFFARLLGLRATAARRAAEETLERVALAAHGEKLASTLSGGMLRRLSLACGLLGSPPVLLLDEPTVGVDPHSRARILSALRRNANSGVAELYSTHLMEEAEQLCDRVVLIDHGHIIAMGTPDRLIREATTGLGIDVVTDRALPADWLDGLAGVHARVAAEPAGGDDPQIYIARVSVDSFDVTPRVLERAAARGGAVREFHVHRPNLHDAFLALTGHAPRD